MSTLCQLSRGGELNGASHHSVSCFDRLRDEIDVRFVVGDVIENI